MSVDDELSQLRAQVASLTQRVYQLEQRHEREPLQKPEVAPPPPPSPIPPASPRPIEMPRVVAPPPSTFGAISAAPTPIRRSQEVSLERRIGSQWLNRVGIIAVLVGVSYFLKLASDNGWVGPAMRVLIGLAAGVALVWWSERFRRTQAVGFSYSLKAVGIGILYLSLWASFQLYQLAPAGLVFVAMVVVTAATAAMALWQHSELLAGLALVGGFLTPVLLSTGQNNEAVLLTYVALLAAGSVALQRFERWPRVVVGAWIGTLLLYLAWADRYYSPSAYAETVFFLTVLFGIFAAAPFLATYSNSKDDSHTQMFAILAVVNALAFFFELYAIEHGTGGSSRAALDAIALSGLFFGLGLALRRREQDAPANDNVMWQIHQGLAVTFLTIAIAMQLDGSWITFGWLVEAAGLYWVGARSRRAELKAFGGIVLALALVRVVVIDTSNLTNQPFFLNQRFGLYLLSIAVLGVIIWSEKSRPAIDRRWIAIAVVAINLLAITALCLEVGDYFHAQRTDVWAALHTRPPAEYAGAMRGLNIEEAFTYSAVLMAYGVALMMVGFWKRTAFLRWQAILLIGVTIAKVFLYDVSNLERIYRIASFIILGVILLGISYAYQKDLLGLQKGEN